MTSATPATGRYQGRPQKPRKARVKVDLWCEILGKRERAVGHIRNLTVGGCRILSPSAFPIRESLTLILSTQEKEPDLLVKAQLRWMALNPSEGPFELGVQFIHEGGTEGQVERVLKEWLSRRSGSGALGKVSYDKFTGALEAGHSDSGESEGEVRRRAAAEGLDRLLKPDPSVPPPGSP